MDEKQVDKLRDAIKQAGLSDVVFDRFLRMMASCGEACFSGCAACCSTGTANRAFAAQVEQPLNP